MLIDKIKADQLELRKSVERHTEAGKTMINALTTLIGEASPAGNGTTTDEQTIAVIRKFVKNIDESLKNLKSDFQYDDRTMKLNVERDLYSSYLPKEFDFIDVRDVYYKDEFKYTSIGTFMGACKKEAQNQGKMFNGAVVKEFFDSI